MSEEQVQGQEKTVSKFGQFVTLVGAGVSKAVTNIPGFDAVDGIARQVTGLVDRGDIGLGYLVDRFTAAAATGSTTAKVYAAVTTFGLPGSGVMLGALGVDEMMGVNVPAKMTAQEGQVVYETEGHQTQGLRTNPGHTLKA